MTIGRPVLSDAARRAAGVDGPARTTARFLALTLALFVVLTAVMTYPQVLRMSDGVHDPGDPLMVTWVLAWVAHQLPQRAGAHLRRQYLLSRAQHARLFRDLLVPGLFAAPLHWLGRRADPGLQPRLPVRLRALRCRRRAPGAPADRQRRRGDRRRHRLRVSAVPHRSLRPSAAAADAVHPAHDVGVPSTARQRPPARRRAARRVSPRVRCCRACTTASS